MVLPGDLGPECLRTEWRLEIHSQESKVLEFWDTFEWGLWFGGHVLYRCGGVYNLCRHENGTIGAVVCVRNRQSVYGGPGETSR